MHPRGPIIAPSRPDYCIYDFFQIIIMFERIILSFDSLIDIRHKIFSLYFDCVAGHEYKLTKRRGMNNIIFLLSVTTQLNI